MATLLVTIGSTIIMGGIAGVAYFKQNGPATNDAEKIQKIFANVGWNGKNGETIRLQRKAKFNGGTEYIYQIPLGFDRKDIERKKHILEDGLNIRHKFFEFDKSELLKLKMDKNLIKQIKKILTTQRTSKKEIDLEFDGMLRIKIYNNPIPNKIEWSDNYLKNGSLSVIVGVTRNKNIYHDFDKSKHLIVAGATGGGKSVSIKGMITALIKQDPDNVTFSLIDLKGGPAFARFKDCKQVINYGIDNDEALEILKDVQQRMKNEYKVIVNGGFEDITEAGSNKRHFIFIDEAADLVDKKEAMEILTDIVRKGRAAGYYVIYTTQYPSSQAVPMQIKRNIPARLCFALDDSVASQTVLDAPGAEDLPEIPGRAIYKNGKMQIVQCPYMSNDQIKERITPHIVFKTKEGHHEPTTGSQTAKDRKHSIEFKKV